MTKTMLPTSLHRNVKATLFAFFLCFSKISSFQFQRYGRFRNTPSISNPKIVLFARREMNENNDCNDDGTRRKLLGFVFVSTCSTYLLPSASYAYDTNNPLFKQNPLLNPALEQFRIWDQAEADNIRYGGELERGDAGNKGKVDSYPRLLVPILKISEDLDRMDLLIQQQQEQQRHANGVESQSQYEYYNEVLGILSKSTYGKIQFKRIFNAYADNIYYSDPDRANLYLAGGATPKTEQSLGYLLRNDILTNIESLQAEIPYIIMHPEESTIDLNRYISSARDAMKQYLDVVPRNELQKAKELVSTTSSP